MNKNIFLLFFAFNLIFAEYNKNDKLFIDSHNLINLQIGEELVYDVSYGFIKIGEIKLIVTGLVQKGNKTLYTTKGYINSNNYLPFVNVHYVFYSEIDNDGYSHFFSGTDTKNPKEHYYQDYVFNYATSDILIEKGNRTKKRVYFKGKEFTSLKQQDGLSLFYYSRINLFSKEKFKLPTYINEKKGSVDINFKNIKKSVKINSIKYPVETLELDGKINIEGIFGLIGPYIGWFSNDQAAIPIKAKLKVLIGNVDIELKSWNRTGWIPPKSN